MTALLFATALWAQTPEGTTYTVSPGVNIIAAVNALRPGDTLLLNPGTYGTGGNWLVTCDGTEDKPIIVQGLGAVTLTTGTPRDGPSAVAGNKVSFVTWRHLRFYGWANPMRFIGGAEGVVVEDCEFVGNYRHGIRLEGPGTRDVVVRRCWFHDTSGGVAIGNAAGVTIEDCRAERLRADLMLTPLPHGWIAPGDTHLAVTSDDCTGLEIRRCWASGCGCSALDIQGGGVIEDCYSTGSPNGYKLWGRYDPLTIRNSVAWGNLDTGLTAGGGLIGNLRVEHCTFAYNGRCGIRPNARFEQLSFKDSVVLCAATEIPFREYRSKTGSALGEYPHVEHCIVWKPIASGPYPPEDERAWYKVHDNPREVVAYPAMAAAFPSALLMDPLLADAVAGRLQPLPGSPCIGIPLGGIGAREAR
jgi:hypothetical protein